MLVSLLNIFHWYLKFDITFWRLTSKSVTKEAGWWSSSVCSDGARLEDDDILIFFFSPRRLLLSGEILNMHAFPISISVWVLLSFEFYSPENIFFLSLGYTVFFFFFYFWQYFIMRNFKHTVRFQEFYSDHFKRFSRFSVMLKIFLKLIKANKQVYFSATNV